MMNNAINIIQHFGQKATDTINENIKPLSILYANLYNDNWPDENWTPESAKKELIEAAETSSDRKPFLSLIFCAGKIVGFSFVIHSSVDCINEKDVPFNFTPGEKAEVIKKLRKRLLREEENKVLVFREIAIEKKFRSYRNQHMPSVITLPLMEQSEKIGIRPLFYWTSFDNEMYKLGLRFNWEPFEKYPQKNRVIVWGTVPSSIYYLRGIIAKKRHVLREMNKNYQINMSHK